MTKTNAIEMRRRAFAEHIAGGKSGVEAARLAGFKGNARVLEVTASRLLRNAIVQDLLHDAAAKASTKRVLTATERRELLTEWATQATEPADLRDRIAAVKELNAMDGLHIKKLEHSGPGGQPFGAILATVPDDAIRARLAALSTPKVETPHRAPTPDAVGRGISTKPKTK